MGMAMRFKKRVVLLILLVLIFTVVSAVRMLGQLLGSPENLGLDSQGRLGQNRRDDSPRFQDGLGVKVQHQDHGGESQIRMPPLPRDRAHHGGRTVLNNAKKQQPAWERGSTFKKTWDDQKVIGIGHPWQQFHRDIHRDALYRESAPYMTDLLHDLATVEIVNASMFTGGSQVKLDFRLADGNRAIVKPMRLQREHVYKYNHKEPFWLDPERHNAEVASFHLDRVLGFRRVPPCTGRLINLTREVVAKSNDQDLLDTFFRKDGNLCFIGKCAPWFCNKEHPICAKGDIMEMSMCQFLPSFEGGIPLFELEYPWSQGIKEALVWKGRNVCLDYLKDPVWRRGRFLLDLVEQGIFDFLIRNYDRHHFDMLRKYKRLGHVMSLDNGKGFGNPVTDDTTFLAPVYQCCKLRRSTYLRLKELTRPESRLSDLLRSSMSNDPITPVITESHFQALDRRLETALQTVDKCIKENGEKQVLVERLDN